MQEATFPSVLFKSVRLLNPSMNQDTEADVLVKEGRVAEIANGLFGSTNCRVIEGKGRWLTPGFIDLHAHLREPGEEYKEDIASGSRAALAAGFTSVCAMPNTKPVNDCLAVTQFIKARANEVSGVRVFPIGSISKGLLGQQLSDIGDLKQGGCVAISDDGRCVMNARLMRRALEYARTFEMPVVQHAEDENLTCDGVMNEGALSSRLGLKGRPACAESMIVARDIELIRLTGARYHVAHISTKSSLDFVRSAKRMGLPVTCEVTPHHFTLTEDACLEFNTAAKVNPPLRHKSDLEALIEGLIDDTIDAVATDHAPHSEFEKDIEFDCAAPGMLGFETALPLVLDLVRQKYLSPLKAIEKMTLGPAKTFSLPFGTLKEGSPADLTLIDPDCEWILTASEQLSKSRNSPFFGRRMRGRSLLTMVGGSIKYERHLG